MADNKKEKELEERKAKRENKKLEEEDLGTEVSRGSLKNVSYTKTGKITQKIKKKI